MSVETLREEIILLREKVALIDRLKGTENSSVSKPSKKAHNVVIPTNLKGNDRGKFYWANYQCKQKAG